jgi:predicted RNase H-like HicB family nuclease
MMEGRDRHYSLVIRWDPRDSISVATVPELEGCAAHGAAYEAAVHEALDAIDTWVMGEDPASLPAPHLYPAEAPV